MFQPALGGARPWWKLQPQLPYSIMAKCTSRHLGSFHVSAASHPAASPWGTSTLRTPWTETQVFPGVVWWVDPGWMPGPHQSHSITPLLNWTGERKLNERLVGRDKDRERSLTNYHHGQNRLDLGKLVYYQSSQSRIMRNKTKP